MQQLRKPFASFSFTSAVDCKLQERPFARKQVGADCDRSHILRPFLLHMPLVS